MAPKRGGRGAGGAAKKAKIEKDPVKESVKMLVSAFEDEDQVGLSTVPAVTKEMLGSIIPMTLGAGAAEDERHSYQIQMTDAIGEVLKEVVKIWEGKVTEAKNGVVAAEKVKTIKDDAAAAAESALEARSSETTTAQEKLVAAKQAVVDANTNLGKCKDEVDSFDVQLTKKEGELEKVKAVVTESFTVLKTGVDWPSEKDQKAGEKKHLGAIASTLKHLHADTSLMSALESALVKKPEDRGPFDTMAIDQLENILTSKVNEYETFVNNAESNKAEKTAAVTTAETTLADSEAAKTASDEALDAAKKAQKEAQAALKDAKKAVDHQAKEVDGAKSTAEDADTSLEDAKKHVEAFEFLYSRPSKAPEPEPVEVEEPPAEPPASEEAPVEAPAS